MYKVVVLVGLILTAVSAIPYFASSFTSYVSISVSGYGTQYENVSYGINSLMSKIGEFFPVGAITLLYAWGKKNNYNASNFIIKLLSSYLIIASYLVMELLLSQRTGVLLFAIALLFVYFPHKKIPKILVICAAGAALILMAGMRMIDLLRSGGIHSIADFFTYSGGNSNPILDFLGDLGWNLMTTIEFQEIMPQAIPYGYGFTYLISLTSVIPNLNFWDIHPATAYGNISAWLQNYLGFSFGIGCTPVAEAYYNFGDFGWLVFIPWGYFMVYLTKKFEDRSSILNNYCVVLFMGILLKSVVRSSFSAVFRPFIFYVIFPIMLTKMLYKALRR